ncbi:hypothetical protein [Mycolicibacterium sp.]
MSDPNIRLLFTPEQLRSFGRCDQCGWHPPTQGHDARCPHHHPEES